MWTVTRSVLMPRAIALVAFSSLVSLPAVAVAQDSGAQEDRCAAYAQRAVQQFALMQSRPSCQLKPDLRWQASYDSHYRGCKAMLPAMARSEEAIRDRHLRSCGALSSQPASQPPAPPVPSERRDTATPAQRGTATPGTTQTPIPTESQSAAPPPSAPPNVSPLPSTPRVPEQPPQPTALRQRESLLTLTGRSIADYNNLSQWLTVRISNLEDDLKKCGQCPESSRLNEELLNLRNQQTGVKNLEFDALRRWGFPPGINDFEQLKQWMVKNLTYEPNTSEVAYARSVASAKGVIDQHCLRLTDTDFGLPSISAERKAATTTEQLLAFNRGWQPVRRQCEAFHNPVVMAAEHDVAMASCFNRHDFKADRQSFDRELNAYNSCMAEEDALTALCSETLKMQVQIEIGQKGHALSDPNSKCTPQRPDDAQIASFRNRRPLVGNQLPASMGLRVKMLDPLDFRSISGQAFPWTARRRSGDRWNRRVS